MFFAPHSVLQGVVTLSNHSESNSGPFASALGAGIKVKTDGTVWSTLRFGTDDAQVNSSTDWIIPNGAADSSYYVKIEEVSVTGTDFSPQFFNDGGAGKNLSTWMQLTSDRYWGCYSDEHSKLVTWTITLHIKRGSTGSEIDSANIQLTHNNTD